MSDIYEQGIHARHAYTPLLPAVKTGQPRFSAMPNRSSYLQRYDFFRKKESGLWFLSDTGKFMNLLFFFLRKEVCPFLTGRENTRKVHSTRYSLIKSSDKPEKAVQLFNSIITFSARSKSIIRALAFWSMSFSAFSNSSIRPVTFRS